MLYIANIQNNHHFNFIVAITDLMIDITTLYGKDYNCQGKEYIVQTYIFIHCMQSLVFYNLADKSIASNGFVISTLPSARNNYNTLHAR